VKLLRALAATAVVWGIAACGGGAQEADSGLVISSDRNLGALAAALLPELAARSGLELREPVRIELRSREQLVRYLRAKLDEELPEGEATARVQAYALLGMVPDTLDLRAVLLSLYTEQVAGFYEPDSTALFVMDDQPQASLQGLLVHELVHAVQDQSVDLGALTDPDLGNDRATAAQAAIEGHATLVMLEYMTEQMRGAPVDLSQIPDFADQLRPALEGMRAQFPALARAPRVIQESLLFPYLEGAGYVQALWADGTRVAPFGAYLPTSTEEVLSRDRGDEPVELALSVDGGRVVSEDVLGMLEVGILLDEHLGSGGSDLAEGWGGDRYALVEPDGGGRGLAWFTVWDDGEARDRFAEAVERELDSFGPTATFERVELAGRPGAVLRLGALAGVRVTVREAGAR
jgi:Putative metallopeptidase family (DUF6782)